MSAETKIYYGLGKRSYAYGVPTAQTLYDGINSVGIEGIEIAQLNWPADLANTYTRSAIVNHVGGGYIAQPFAMGVPDPGPIHQLPTPYVSITEDAEHAGRKRSQTTTISLDGQITGADYQTLMDYETQLINNFREQRGPLLIVDDGTVVFVRSDVEVVSINFSPSKHANIVDYSILLSARNFEKSDNIENDYDKYVKNTEDSFSFSENGDGTASLTHSISAQGVARQGWSHAGGASMRVAKNWVENKRGWKNQIWPSYIQFESVPVLVSETESQDIFGGTFSLSEEYIYNVRRSKTTTRGGGAWSQIIEGIKNGTPVYASYSFAPAGAVISKDGCGQPAIPDTAIATTAGVQSGTVIAFAKWKAVFENAFPDAYARGFRLHFENKGVENENTVPVQGVGNEHDGGGYVGLYSLLPGSEAYEANIGDFRIASITSAPYGGCASFPPTAGGTFGVNGHGGGDVLVLSTSPAGILDGDECGGDHTSDTSTYGSAASLMFHELGHSLGFGHDRDDSDLTIMSYVDQTFKRAPLKHKWVGPPEDGIEKFNCLSHWYPQGPENHVQILHQVRGMYGAGGYADRPVITVRTSIDSNMGDDFGSVSATITLKGGQRWTQDDLREYIKADKIWHPGTKGIVAVDGFIMSIVGGADAQVGSSWDTTDGTGPEYKSLFHIVRESTPADWAWSLNPVPASYSIEDPHTDTVADHASELRISVTYDTNWIFGNTPDYELHNIDDTNAYYDYTVSVSCEGITDICEVSIEGQIVARTPLDLPRGGLVDGGTDTWTTRWVDWLENRDEDGPPFIDSAKAKLVAAQTFLDSINDLEHYLYLKAEAVYSAAGYTCWTLNPKPKTINIDKDPFNSRISMSASFDSSDWVKDDYFIPLTDREGSLYDLTWTMNLKPSLPKFEKATSYNINGLNLIYDIGVMKREMIDITVKANYYKDKSLKMAADDIIAYMYCDDFLLKQGLDDNAAQRVLIVGKNPKMTAENISYNEVNKSIELKASFSQEHGGYSSTGPIPYYPLDKIIIRPPAGQQYVN